MTSHTLTFYPIPGGEPDEQWVHLGTSPGTRIGSICRDEDAPQTWMAKPIYDDAFTPGFKTEVRAGEWLADVWLARQPAVPVMGRGH